MQLDRDFREFIESFAAHDVRYLVVGGYALAAHGLPRATGDLDAWVWLDIEGVGFDEAWPRRLTVELNGLPLHVIGLDDLIRNKIAADRPQDRVDVDRLRRSDDASTSRRPPWPASGSR